MIEAISTLLSLLREILRAENKGNIQFTLQFEQKEKKKQSMYSWKVNLSS